MVLLLPLVELAVEVHLAAIAPLEQLSLILCSQQAWGARGAARQLWGLVLVLVLPFQECASEQSAQHISASIAEAPTVVVR